MDKHDLFSVHVGNVPPNTSTERFSQHFSPAGDVEDVFISPIGSTGGSFTYGFVRFVTLIEARKACTLLNNSQFDGSILRVSLSDSTRKKLSPQHESNGKSIVRDPMPRLEGNKYCVSYSEERSLHNQLKKCLNCLNNKDNFTKWLGVNDPEERKCFMEDLKCIVIGMAHVPLAVGIDPIKFDEKPVDKSTLEDIILRYHEVTEPKQVFKEVDLDVTNNRTLNKTESETFFPPSVQNEASAYGSLDGSISICNYDEFCKMKH